MKVSYGYHRNCYSHSTNKTRIASAAKRYKQVEGQCSAEATDAPVTDAPVTTDVPVTVETYHAQTCVAAVTASTLLLHLQNSLSWMISRIVILMKISRIDYSLILQIYIQLIQREYS